MAQAAAAALEGGTSKKKKTGRAISSVVIKVIVILICFVDIYPIFWMITASFKQSYEWSAKPAYALPEGIYFQNYIDAWNRGHMSTFFMNSLLPSPRWSGREGSLSTATSSSASWSPWQRP